MQKNDLFRDNGTIYRVIEVGGGKVLVIDCIKLTMPTWVADTICETLPFEELLSATNKVIPSIESLSQEQISTMHQRFTLIAPILSYVADEHMRARIIEDMSERYSVNKQTIRKYLCLYLAYPNITILAPIKKEPTKALTEDEKNFRWALNKYYYTRYKHSLKTTYLYLLKDKYTDASGSLVDKAINNIKTKVILLSATPESVEWLAERWRAKVYDFRGCTPYIKPKTIEVTNYLLAERNITQKVKDGQTVVYYCSHLNKLFPLIKESLANGIAEEHIAVDIADISTLEKLEDKYPTIFRNSKQLEETLSSQEIIDSQFKLILTNSKCKEAININSKVDLLVIESHYITDIIQICGRFRSGIDKAYIIENAHQFQCFDDFYDEMGYYSNRIEFDNKELERRTFDAPQGIIYYPIHHNRDTLQYINKIICQSHYETYNLFTEKFEVDELYVHFKEHYTTSVKVLETLLSNRQQFSMVYPYFEGITISYSSGTIEEGYIETIFEERGWTIGETKLSYDEFVGFCNLLKEKYISLSSSKKKYKNNKPILNFFGLNYSIEGHKGSKEKSNYIISKLLQKDSE